MNEIVNSCELEYERIPNINGSWLYRIHGYLYLKQRIRVSKVQGEILDLKCKFFKKQSVKCRATIHINNTTGEWKQGKQIHTCCETEDIQMAWERKSIKAEQKIKNANRPPPEIVQLTPKILVFKNYGKYCRSMAIYAAHGTLKNKKIVRITVKGAENLDGIEQKAYEGCAITASSRILHADGEAELIRTIVQRLKMNKPMSTFEIKNLITSISQQKPDQFMKRLSGPISKTSFAVLRKKYEKLFHENTVTIEVEFDENIRIQTEELRHRLPAYSSKTNVKKKTQTTQTQKKSEQKFDFHNQQICRFCMEVTSDNNYDIPVSFYHKFEKFTGVQLDEDEKYPKILCENCHLKFGSFLEFLQEILMNQMRLQKMFGESKPDLSFSQSFEEMDIDNISIKSEPQEYESAVFQCENVFVDNLSVVNDHNQDQTSEDIEDESYPTLIDEDMKLKEICKVEQEQSFEEIDNETKPSLTSKPDDKNENLFGDSLLCDVCGISFKDRYSLKIHNLEKHVDDSVFKCKYCSENCKSIGNLRYHILTKHKIGEYKCSECHEIFDTVIKLRNHLQKHQPLVQCPFCEKSFVKFKLSTHIKNVHEVDKQSCELCGKVCENKRKLQKHITRSHKSQT